MGDRKKNHALLFRALCQAAIAFVAVSACDSTPDPRTTRGCLSYAASALENGEIERLFRVIDERSRHALYSIHADRAAAAAQIEEDYPEDLRESALEALGPAGSSPAGLFGEKCDEACRQALSQRVGAPMEEEEDGDELVVTTPRGEVRLYRAEDTDWWGIVWRREELDRERDRAGQDLRQVQANAETYRRRRALRGN